MYTLPMLTTDDLCGLATGSVSGKPVMFKTIIEIPESDAICGNYTKKELRVMASLKKNMPSKEVDIKFIQIISLY